MTPIHDPRAPVTVRRRWPTWLAVLALLALVILAGFWHGVQALDVVPVSLTIDGQRIVDDIDLAGLPPAHKVVLVAVLAFAALTALLAVPLGLMLLLLALALAVLLPLAIGLAVVVIVTSPLWLLAWLLWRALRGSTPASATMGA